MLRDGRTEVDVDLCVPLTRQVLRSAVWGFGFWVFGRSFGFWVLGFGGEDFAVKRKAEVMAPRRKGAQVDGDLSGVDG